MSGAETARRRVVQRRVGGTETAAPKWPSPHNSVGFRTTTTVEARNDVSVFCSRNNVSSYSLKIQYPICKLLVGTHGIRLVSLVMYLRISRE